MDEEVTLIDKETSEIRSQHDSSPTEQVKSPFSEERHEDAKRPEDILSLVKHYIKLSQEQLDTGPKELSKEAEGYLLSCDWRGKVKELENTVKKACILSDGEILHIEDFELRQRKIRSIDVCSFIEEKLKVYVEKIKSFEKFNLYGTVIPEVEKALIMMLLKETKGNQTKAARLLGINRNTLREKIKKLKIKTKP